jgi:hypothetical protein
MVTDEPQQRINGDGETAVDIVLPTLLHRAGETSQVIKLGNGIPLRNGTPVTVPFAVPSPEDAPPTAEAAHSSLVWFLEATLMYSKWTQGIEKVRRQIGQRAMTRQAREIAEACATCSDVGRTPV